jgi:hypothetical protein
MLNLLGAELGRDLLEPQCGINDRGFWELRPLVELNERLLAELGRHWSDLDPLPDHWWQQPEMQRHETAAAALLRGTFAEADSLCALKDPRLCLLLPFWLRVIDGLGWRPIAVLVLRDCEEVTASLCRRDPLAPSTARLLWLRYNAEAERHSRGILRVALQYRDVLEDWRQAANLLRGKTGIEWPRDTPGTAAQIARELDPGLRHHHHSAHQEVPRSLVEHVEKLLTAGAVTLDETALDAAWDALDTEFAAAPQLALACREAGLTLRAVAAKRDEVGQELTQARETVQMRDAQLATCHGQLQRLGEEHTHAQAVVTERDAQLAALRGDCEHLQQVLDHPAMKLLRRSLRL